VTPITLFVVVGTRAQARVEVIAEIKRLALLQLAEHGAPGLSLRAIARSVGMVSSGIYRYYPSRDDLLTALIIDAYESLGAAAERADSGCRRVDLWGRWRATATAARTWALEHRPQWGLIFGTPVPGYAAPVDTIGAATRFTAVLIELLIEQESRHGPIGVAVHRPLVAQLVDLADRSGAPVSPQAMQVGLQAWTTIVGAITMELFGHYHNVIEPADAMFDAIVVTYGTMIFGPPKRR
jgi:AcrR family transcriptional regulator